MTLVTAREAACRRRWRAIDLGGMGEGDLGERPGVRPADACRSPKVPPPTTSSRRRPRREPRRSGSAPSSSAVKYRVFESADQASSPTWRSKPSVRLRGGAALAVVDHEPPAIGLVAGAHLRAERDHRCRRGCSGRPRRSPGFAAIFFGSPPATGTTNRSALVEVASTASSLREKQTSLPSGETP